MNGVFRAVRLLVRGSSFPLICSLLVSVANVESADREAPKKARTLEIAATSAGMTVNVHEVPLADVLEAIGRHAGILIVLGGTLDTLVSETLIDIPLDQGIRRLSRGHSVVFIYAGASAAANDAALSEVWVMSASSASGSRDPYSVTPRAGAGPRDDGRGADTRGRSTASERPVQLTRALKFGTLETRLRLIEAVVRERGEHAAIDVLRDAATHDADPRIRMGAIQVLTFMPSRDAVEAIRATLGDRHAGVRAEALSALRQLSQAPRRKGQAE
jgi:hypothetical protein